MSQSLGQHDFHQLLEELEQRVLAQENLAKEYEQAHQEFLNGSTNDAPTQLRFREWFLIERDAQSLGASPAVAWAPEDLQSEDIWQRLLESFLGIFFEVSSEDEDRPILEDLWSGRQIRLDRPLPASDDNLVIVGRCAQGSEDSHVLLPGVVFLAADGLRDALSADLSRIRAEQPRGRLSQRQSERLLLPFREQPQPEMMAEEAIELLEDALAGEAQWSSDRLLELANEHGLTEALNMLAFETSVDLEPIRTALTNLQAASAQSDQEEPALATPESAADDVISSSAIKAAITAFETARNGGNDLNDSFEILEQNLGIPVGESQPFSEITQGTEVSAESMGPDEIPGISMWLATFLWEKEIEGITTEESEAREISAFLEHLQNTRGAQLDPEEVEPGDLLGYMLRSETCQVLEERLSTLMSFVHWLVDEQGSPLKETVAALTDNTGNLLRDVVTLNQMLTMQNAAKDHIAWLKMVKPLKVGAEGGEMVPLVGVPQDCNFNPSVGDCLMGTWHNAQFHLGAWLPKQLLPKPQGVSE